MPWRDLWTYLLLGLGSGGMYVLAAVGVVLVHRGSGVVNFAHGAMGMVGTFVWYELRQNHGWPTWLSIVVGIATSAALGMATHLVVVRPMRSRSALLKVIGTLAILGILQAGASLRYVIETAIAEPIMPFGTWKILGATVGKDRTIIFIVSMSLTGLLWLLYTRTSFGLATTAVSENRRGAAALGLSPDVIALANWGIGSALAGLAGIMLAPIIGLGVTTLTILVIPVLAAAVMGKFQSFPLTLAAGLIIGVLISESIRFQSEIWDFFHYEVKGIASSLPFVLTIGVLLFRGSSIAGKGESGQGLPSIGTGRIRPGLVVVLAAILLAMVWGWFSPEWTSAVLTQLVAAILVLSLVVVSGYAGQLSLCQWSLGGLAAFFAAKIAVEWGAPFLVALLIGALLMIPVGLIIGLGGVRTRGLNLAIVTLGAAVMIESVVLLDSGLTGGQQGFQLPKPTVFGYDVNSITHIERYTTLVLFVLVLLALGVANLRRSRVGRRLIAVRANERAAASLGVSVVGAKLYAFSLGGVIAGVGGTLLMFREPTANFSGRYGNPFKSIAIVQEAVIGGLGWIGGAFLGAGFEPGTTGSKILDSLPDRVIKYLFLFAGVAIFGGLLFNERVRAVLPKAVQKVRLLLLVAALPAAVLLEKAPIGIALALGLIGLVAVAIGLRATNATTAQTRDAYASLLGVPLFLAGGLVVTGLIKWKPTSVDRYLFLVGGLLLLFTLLKNPNGIAAQAGHDLGPLIDRLSPRSRRAQSARRLSRELDRELGETALIENEPADTAVRVKPKSLEVRGLSVNFGGVQALADLDLDVNPGEVVGFIGPNGAGKTTAIEAITGFVAPSKGTVVLDGRDVTSASREQRARGGLGRSFQQLELFDDMTVLENLLAASEPRDFGAYITALVKPGKAKLTPASMAAIREFDLDDDLHKLPTELSYGKRRLVAIARSVAAEPSVLLLDEPAAGLDETETRELGHLIRRLAREWGMAVLLIEHDVQLVLNVSDRVYAIQFGRPIGNGTPDEIRANPAVIEAYLGAAHATV